MLWSALLDVVAVDQKLIMYHGVVCHCLRDSGRVTCLAKIAQPLESEEQETGSGYIS